MVFSADTYVTIFTVMQVCRILKILLIFLSIDLTIGKVLNILNEIEQTSQTLLENTPKIHHIIEVTKNMTVCGPNT